jgi:hypothetical protein
MKNELVIYTDCSHYRKVGSWSVLFQTEDDPIIISGICPEYVSTAAQGEAYAIFKAIGLAKKLFPLQKNLKINTDCSGLCFVLKPDAMPQRSAINRMLQQQILKLLNQNHYSWEVLFVRGHQKVASEESKYNDLVDLHARLVRRKSQKMNSKPKTGLILSMKSWIKMAPAIGFSNGLLFRVLEKLYSPVMNPETVGL